MSRFVSLFLLLSVAVGVGVGVAGTPGGTGEISPDLEAALTAVRAKPESVARKLDESRILYYLGLAATGEDRQLKIFGEGRELALAVRSLEPANPGGMLWWAAHEGEIADIKRGFYGLNAIGKIRDTLVELKSAYPAYEHGAADLALARLYQKAPGFISIGSSRKAEEHFKAALAIDAEHPGNQIYYANFLLEEDEKVLARELAQAGLASPRLAKSPVERAHWTGIARKILEKTEVRK